ncbi:MAG: hypothetical protein J7K04_07485, partial [Spirochaetales bacterium]|nr:hypothetical protein [Spirochaetales bacterium]
RVAVLSKVNETAAVRVLPGSVNVQIEGLILIPADLMVWGFSVSGPDNAEINSVGVIKVKTEDNGLFVNERKVTIGPGIEIQNPVNIKNYNFRNLSAKLDRTFFPEFVDEKPNKWILKLSFKAGESKNYSYLNVGLGSKKDSDSFGVGTGGHAEVKVKIAPGRHTIFLYPADIGFTPDTISIAAESSARDNEFGLTGIKAINVNQDPLLPLPADLGSILNYKECYWRRKDFEFFSWNLFPGILVFDTENYSIQSKMLKRIAFFTEKSGFVGTIPDEKTVAGLHGYNAHDYRAEDLAGFFNFALGNSIELNLYEQLLKNILIKRGIIKLSKGNIIPGNGGIISISRSSSAALRRLLLTHESFHGIFFSVPEYRRDCIKVWGNLKETEKRFWKLFLYWKKYDISNEYLVVNEFQAYMFQQREKDATKYYMDYIMPKMLRYYRDKDKKVLFEFTKQYSDHFTRVYEKLENYLWISAGVRGGDDFNTEYISR